MLSIIIVSFNTEKLLSDCLMSIYAAKLSIPYEVIVVDNNSSDGSCMMCRTHFPEVRLLENNVNNMFAKANNQAIEAAKGDYFLLLNSDTVVNFGSIEKMYEYINGKPSVAAVGPRVLNSDGSVQSQGYPIWPLRWVIIKQFGLERLLPKKIASFLFPWTNVSAIEPIRVGWVSGACIMISKIALQHCGGGLCEELYFYGEEVEWCWRAKKKLMEVWVLPDASIIHYGGASSSLPEAPKELFIKKRQMQSTLVLVQRTTGIPFNLMIGCVIVFSCCIKIPLCFIDKRRRKNIMNQLQSEIEFMLFQVKSLFK